MGKTTETGKTFLPYFKASILSHKIQKAAIAVMAAGVMSLTGCESGDMPVPEIPGGAPSLSDSISAAIHVRATYAAKAGETVRLYKPTINIEKMFIGGKEVKPQAEYTFHEAGEYTVSYSLGARERTENIFLFCTALKEISFSEGVKAISPYTCYGCSSLESVKLPSSVTEIGIWAFAGCASLTSIEIPKGVSAIPEYIFFDCRSLKTVEIPESIAEIGIYAFYNCTALDSVKLPAAVKNIGRCAFMGCKALTSIVIPKGVGKIEKQTFAYCTSLASITCKAMTAPSLGGNVFYSVNPTGILTVPTGATGYDEWMAEEDGKLGRYSWKIEIQK